MVEEGRTFRCAQCGNLMREGDKFCRDCGVMLTPTRTDDAAEAPPARNLSSQGASAREDGIASVVVGVVVVLLLLTGIVALVGGRSGGDRDTAAGDGVGAGSVGGEAADGSSPSPADSQYDSSSGDVDPEFEEIIDAWSSSGTNVPLLLPTYTPFAIDGVNADPFGTDGQNYYVWSDASNQLANAIRVEILDAAIPAEDMAQHTISIDGQEYPYTEDASMITGTEPQEGQYTVLLWVSSEDGEEYWYYVEMNTMLSPLPYEEFAKTIGSMKRLDPSDI